MNSLQYTILMVGTKDHMLTYKALDDLASDYFFGLVFYPSPLTGLFSPATMISLHFSIIPVTLLPQDLRTCHAFYMESSSQHVLPLRGVI